MFHAIKKTALTIILLASSVNIAFGQAKDILWFGNSFTNATCCGGSQSVPNTFRLIAIAAGHPAPRNNNASANGQSLQWHLVNNSTVITTGIVASEKWEHVVLQDFSTMPTRLGSTAQHISSSVALYQKVALHSPNVVPVMYETWARGFGHSYYAGGAGATFPGGPSEMQAEIRSGYQQSTAAINAAVASDIGKYAPVGDVWESTGFAANMYHTDIYHANDRGTLLNALVLYATIYEDYTVSDINLSTVLTNFNPDLTPADGIAIAGAVDAYFASLVVPEPSSAALLLLGSVGMLRRRR
jgi:hypothetical protein